VAYIKVDRNRSSIIILMSLLISQTINLFSQDFSFRKYGVKDGLPQSQCTILFQDSRGFIWIGTKNGLSRFDGIDFVNYFRKDGLPSNLINEAFEDRDGQIWALSNGGLSRYTGDSFVFYPPGEEISRKIFYLRVIPTGTTGKFLLLSSLISGSSFRLTQFEHGIYADYSSYFPSLDTLKIREFAYDHNNDEVIILDISGFLYSWNEKTLEKIDNRQFHGIHQDRGKILLYSNEEICEYRDHKVFPHRLINDSGRCEVHLKYSSPQDRLDFFDGETVFPLILTFNISGSFIDNDGTLWLQSENNLFRLQSTAFTYLNDEIIKTENLWAICTDRNDKLWLGSLYGDLYEFDGKLINRVDYVRKLVRSPEGFYKGSRLLSNGELWISTSRGVLIWDGKSFRKLNGLPDFTQVCYIYEDKSNGKIFIGTGNGLYVIDNGRISLRREFNDNELGVVEGMVKDDMGFYWISGHRGVIRFDGFTAERVIEDELPRTFTYNIEKDSKGGIWVSTEEGLFCKRKSDKNFRIVLPPDLNRPVNTLKVMDDSHILAGRTEDITVIDLEKYYEGSKDYFRIYDQTDGFPGGECLDNGIVRSVDGSFWILTSDNVVRFDPAKIRKNNLPPKVSITGISYETDSLTWQPLRRNEFYYGIPGDIVLGRNDHKVKITYTGISTPNPEGVKYVSRLIGLEDKWSLPSKAREKVYDHLSPGNYTFMLKAVNADGVETSSPVVLGFRIKKSIWETTLFKLLYIIVSVILTAFATWLIIKTRQKQTEERQKVNSQLQRLQISSVLNQFDPHFTFNAISSIGYLIMKNSREEAYSYLTRLSSLLRSVLYDGSLIIRSVQDELDFVTNYCELQKLRFGNKFEYYIAIGGNVDIHKKIPRMAIQTFVENSLKHGFGNRKKGGRVEIELTMDDGFLKITVRDNGIGRAASAKVKTEGSGHGIRTVNKIFEIMNGYNTGKATVEINDLISNGKVAGTEVVVRIPEVYVFNTE
jgi:ligand-binding sensor domain-containing protein